jgi:hypothetical protein
MFNPNQISQAEACKFKAPSLPFNHCLPIKNENNEGDDMVIEMRSAPARAGLRSGIVLFRGPFGACVCNADIHAVGHLT